MHVHVRSMGTIPRLATPKIELTNYRLTDVPLERLLKIVEALKG